MWRRCGARPALAGRLRDVTDARTDTDRVTVRVPSARVTAAHGASESLTIVELALLCRRSVEQIEAEIASVNDP